MSALIRSLLAQQARCRVTGDGWCERPCKRCARGKAYLAAKKQAS